ncbi:hypothetical protein [Nesterenkonia sp. F]|nr:hypothetical protein [Nesterenkonia sp. F]
METISVDGATLACELSGPAADDGDAADVGRSGPLPPSCSCTD